MYQSELIERVARATELNQQAAGQAVKAVVSAILDSLVAGEAVRVSGLGTFNATARPARTGRNPQNGESPSAKSCGFTRARLSRMPSIRRRALVARSPPHQRNPRHRNKPATTASLRFSCRIRIVLKTLIDVPSELASIDDIALNPA